MEWDNQGYITHLVQQDWSIQYLSYQEPPTALPTKITLNNAQLRLKLVIESWQPTSNTDKN
jgi:outer membrane biogenesis lipoprotein LolB